MRVKLYKVKFEVTETLQNGKERRIFKYVFMKPFDENGIHVSPEEQIRRGTEALREAHYYNITYKETETSTLIFG